MARRRVIQPSDTSRRICTKCGVEGALVANFNRCKAGSMYDKMYGCDMPCKSCRSVLSRKSHSKPASKNNARERAATRRETEPGYTERMAARCRAWYTANADKKKANKRAWYAANRTEILERSRRRREDPVVRAAENAAARKEKKTPRGKLNAQVHSTARRLFLRGVATQVTKQEWVEILDLHDHRCAYCLRSGVTLTQDHVVAICRGGEHRADNIVPACKHCNAVKQARPIFLMARYA